MFLLIPFLAGVGSTGYLWYNSKEEEKKPTFQQEVIQVLAPILILILVLLIFRWLYLQGSKNTKTT